jgi:hypothetical protein
LLQPGRTARHFLGFLVIVPESVIPAQIAKYRLIDGLIGHLGQRSQRR